MKKLIAFLCVFVWGIHGSLWAASADKSAEAYPIYLKALLYESQGNLSLALEHFEAALALTPDSSSLNRELASVAIRLGLSERAATAIERAIKLDPKNVKSYILAGQIYWASGDMNLAESRFKTAVELAPDEAEPLMNLAMSVTSKDPHRAIQLYKQYLERHPGEVEIHERVAQIHQGLGELDNAKAEWSKVLEWSPQSLRANLALAQIAEVNSDTGTAISHYEAVLVHDPSNLPLLLRVGELRYRSNDMNQAYEVFSKAKSIAPSSASANFWLALLSEQRGEWQQAIKLLEEVSRNAREPGVLLRLSYYYAQAGERKKGIEILKELSQAEPDNQDFLNYLAVAYEEDGQNKNAEKILRKLLELRPQDPESFFNLGTLYDRMKQYAESEIYFKKAIQLKPDYHMAMNYLGYSYADRNVKLQEAEGLVGAAVALDPDNGAYLDSMGWVYFQMGKFSKAEDFLRTAASKTQDPLIWEHLAESQAAQQYFIDAILSWEESLRLNPDQKKVDQRIQETLQKLNEPQQIDLFIRKNLSFYSDLADFKGLINVEVCQSRPCFDSRAQFLYERKVKLRAEVPGPLTGPVLLLEKPHGKPIQYGAIHPILQSAENEVKRAFEKVEMVLSADFFRYVDIEELKKNASSKGKYILSSGPGVEVRFESKTGRLDYIKWKAGDKKEELYIRAYEKVGSHIFPMEWNWEDADSGLSMKIKFQSPVLTFSPSIK